MKRIRSIHLSRYILLKDLETSIYVSITKWKRIRGRINKRFPILRSKIFIFPFINSIFLLFRIKNCEESEFLCERYYISLYIVITNHCIHPQVKNESFFFFPYERCEKKSFDQNPLAGRNFIFKYLPRYKSFHNVAQRF